MLSQNLFLHHVYFWLNNPDSPEDYQQLLEGLRSLTPIRSIASHHIGKPAGTSRGVIDTSYSLSWLLLFNTKEEQDEYQTDPIHEKFIANCKHLWAKVVVYDSISAY